MRAHALLAAPVVALLACTAATADHTAATTTAGTTRTQSSASVQRSVASTYADWTTYHGNRGRSGYAPSMPATHGIAATARHTLDGAVYASPITVGGHTIIATENNTVYSYTAGSGRLLWKRHLGSPVRRSSLPCGNIDPLGITGTPVYSTGTKLIYVAAEVANPTRHVLYALTTSGAVKWHRSIDLSGVETRAMQQRGALATSGAYVWVPFGGLAGDCNNYKGRLVRAQLNGTGSLAAYTVPTSREAGMWTPPGPAIDSSGFLYQAVGNGAAGPGDRYDLSDSVLKFDGNPRVVDYFAPSSWAQENSSDADLGSQGATLVGPWVFQAGKSGKAYVLRRGHLGHIGGQASSANLCTSFGGTAVVGSTVYVPCTDGVRAVSIDSSGHLHLLWHAASNISGSPVVGGGRVWSLDTGGGRLYGLNPSTGKVLNTVALGASVTRFATPALYGRTIYIGTTSGYVAVSTK